MKEIKKERTTTQTYYEYEAYDGEIFNDKEECKKYEDSAECVLKSQVKQMIVTKEHNAWDLMGGNDDCSVVGIKFECDNDAKIFLQYYTIINPYLSKDSSKDYLDKIIKKVDAVKNNHDILLVGINCDDEYYIINSRNNIIENLKNIDKDAPKEA